MSCALVLTGACNFYFISRLFLDNTQLLDKRDKVIHRPLHLSHNFVLSMEDHLVSVALLLTWFYSLLVHLIVDPRFCKESETL